MGDSVNFFERSNFCLGSESGLKDAEVADNCHLLPPLMKNPFGLLAFGIENGQWTQYGGGSVQRFQRKTSWRVSCKIDKHININVGMKTLKRKFDGHLNLNFTAAQYIELYTIVYKMVTQRQHEHQRHELHVKYREYIEDYIMTTVIPSIREKSGELMLSEVAQRWENHNIMVRFLSRFFYYLDVHDNVWNIVSSLIDEEREGRSVDRALSNKYWAALDELGMGVEKQYPEFEAHCLKDTSDYYSTKASAWMLEYSCLDYLLKMSA